MRYTIANLESSFISAAVKRTSLILALITYLIVTLLVTAAAQAQDVSANIASVQRWADPNRPNALLAIIRLEDAIVNGSRINKQSITFTLSGTQRDVKLAIGIHEGDTVRQINDQVTPVSTSISGQKTFHITQLNRANLRPFIDSLSEDDRKIIQAICGYLTNRRNINAILQQLIRSTDHRAPSNYITTREFFPGSALNVMISELVFMSNRCVDAVNASILDRPNYQPPLPSPPVLPATPNPVFDHLRARISELEEQLAAANQTNVELRDDVADLTPSVGRAETAEAEVVMLQQQNAALNATIADLRNGTVSVSEHQEVEAQLDAANQTIVELQGRVNSLTPFVEAYRTEQSKNGELIQQVEALNATITDLRNSTVSVRDHQEVQSQLAAANQTVVELRDRIGALDNVIQNLQRTVASTNDQLGQARQLTMSLQQTVAARDQQIDALNATVTELRARMENDFVPLDRFNLSQAQLAALNATILELQERNDLQRTRMVEAEAMFRNLRNDCSETPECARAMQLD